MSESTRARLKQLTSKYHKFRTKRQYRADAKLAAADARFTELLAEGKRPPVDMFGRPVSATAFDDYVSSSDEDPGVSLPPDALPSDTSDSDVPTTNALNHRLALTNLPWRSFTAPDLFAILSKALEDRASDLADVTVHLSNFGQQHPPPEDDPPPDGLDEEARNAIWRHKEKAEMKRYFAIATFSKPETADLLYQGLNGCEIEDSGSYFDMSSVPDGVTFDGFPVRDTAASAPDDWVMPVVESPWLNRSKPSEEWDDPKSDRLRAIQAIWDADDSTDNEVAVSLLIGSDSEADERPTRDDVLDLLEGDEEEEEGTEGDDEELDIKFVPNAAQEEAELPTARKKSRKEKKKEAEEKAPDEADVKEILEDERFADMFAKPGYGINAADPKFRRSPMMDKFMAEVAKKHQAGDGFEKPSPKRRPPPAGK
jgi:hypothetical protein